MAGKFEIYTDDSGSLRFRLKASNGQVLIVGDAYDTRDQCLKGIETIRKLAPYAEVSDIAAAEA
ncbi:YegP family protein [Streptomyces sp. NPDC092296]|uniref:YegP family protein n=1 Tax=Streptomyces sp. NPDC092296 TaxID=3366012 RepID=UPI0037FE9224